MSLNLIHNLEKIRIRLKCGQSFDQACSDLPRWIDCRQQDYWEWIGIKKLMLTGDVQISQFIDLFIEKLSSEKEIVDEKNELIFSCVWQSRAALILSLLLLVMRLTSLEKCSFTAILLAGILLIVGHLVSKKILDNFHEKISALSWWRFLKFCQFSLSSGNMFAKAVREYRLRFPNDDWPDDLNIAVDLQKECESKKGQKASQTSIWALSKTQWNFMLQLDREGSSMSSVIESFSASFFQEFKKNMKRSAQNCSIYLLVPLFLFYVPAYLVLLLEPIISKILT